MDPGDYSYSSSLHISHKTESCIISSSSSSSNDSSSNITDDSIITKADCQGSDTNTMPPIVYYTSKTSPLDIKETSIVSIADYQDSNSNCHDSNAESLSPSSHNSTIESSSLVANHLNLYYHFPSPSDFVYC